MKIFIDSADIFEIKEALDWGFIGGVTTNPSSLGKLKKDPFGVVGEICRLVGGNLPVSVEVTQVATAETIAENAQRLHSLAPNVVVKVPVTRVGLRAMPLLVSRGLKINATNLFTPIQALIAARVGAAYVSCWVGRGEDVLIDGIKLVAVTRKIFDNYKIGAEIIACSIKNVSQVVAVAERRADIVTVPFDVLKKMTEHPMTDITLESFLTDWCSNPALREKK